MYYNFSLNRFFYDQITAAHCVHKKRGIPLKIKNIKVLLGVFNISDTSEPCRKEFKVSAILIHGEWDPINDSKYTNDIALLKLAKKIREFTQAIFPICLEKITEILNIENGTVVGYGEFNATRRITSDIPIKVELHIKNAHDWIHDSKNYKLYLASWKDSFVAGSDTSGICPGDSGSGFYVKSNGKFYLGGLVSSSMIDGDYNCTHNSFALYTDLLKYLDEFVLEVRNF